MQNGSSATLELDIEHYVVPAPAANAGPVYAANMAETPRSLTRSGMFSRNDSSSSSSYPHRDVGASVDRPGVWC